MKLKTAILSMLACAMLAGRASALEYTVDAPSDYLFGRPTSMEEIHTEVESPNIDRSKNTALIPPGFGSPTSYLPGSGEYLTPNLVPGALKGGLVTQLGEINYPAASAGVSYAQPDQTAAQDTMPSLPLETVSYQSVTQTAAQPPSSTFTEVTSDLYYSGGNIGSLSIPSLNLDVKIFEGTSSTELAKGAGHFTNTSIWDGNVCVAGHNRGANCYFGDIHTLNEGDKITLTTKLGTRTYSVTSVKKITETDDTDTEATSENCITLFTCVRNQSEFRWCVRAVEV